MNKFIVFSAIALCLATQCASGQYQTAPAYGNAYQQQQRKMAPSPQNYGAQMAGSQLDTAANSNDYDQSAGDEQNKYGSALSGASSNGYANMMQSMAGSSGSAGSYGNQQQQRKQMAGYAAQQQQQQQVGAGYGAKSGAAAYGQQEDKHPPMPYEFGYNIDDGYDNSQYRKENSDGNSVTGSYGYRDSYGVFRYVDYVADENGFRATVKTNEPGTANESPADVDWQAEEPPAQTNPGSKSQSYGSSGSSNSYSSMGAGQSSMGTGSSYGSAKGAGSDMSDLSQYGSNQMSGSPASAAGQKYARSMGMNSGLSSYGSGSAPASASSGSGYGSGAGSMMSAMGAAQKYGAAMSAMRGQPASQKYGAAMMGARQSSGQYGSQSQMGAGSSGSYMGGSGSGTSMAGGSYAPMMAASMGQQQYGGNGAASANAGRSSRYKSQGAMRGSMMSTGIMRSAYAGSGSAVDGGEQYGAGSMGAAGSDLQQYAGEQMSAPAGTKGGSMSAQQSYGAATMGQPDGENDDSALAQQYGPSAMSMMNQNAQQNGGQPASALEGASTYSSMRLQGGKQNQSGVYANNGSQQQMMGTSMSYGGQPAAQMNGAMNYAGQMGKMGAMMMKPAGSDAMDYKRAAAKSIASLVKRY